MIALGLPWLGGTAYCPNCELAGPTSSSAPVHAAWIAELESHREQTLTKLHFAGGAFANPALQWTQQAFIQPQMHPYDRYFYDPMLRNYTVSRYLADVKRRYGGIDAVLMWPTYTNIGIDDRNQFDFFRTMPGGLDAVRRVTQELQAAGVRVLWPYNPWDTGTRREASWTAAADLIPAVGLDSDARTLTALLKQTAADGLNGDTLNAIPRSFWTAALAESYPLAFEPEGGGTDDALNWTTMGWGYWNFESRVPVVDRYKWLTHGKWLTNVCDRWAKNKTDNLQAAWFNGAGYESWENVWGTWNGIVPRDAQAIRRVATMLRALGGSAAILRSSRWVPHTPQVMQDDVFASLWPADATTAWTELRNAWTIVNRAGRDVNGALLQLLPVDNQSRFFDCYNGVEITARHRNPVAKILNTSGTPPRYIAFAGLSAQGMPGAMPIDQGRPFYVESAEECTSLCDKDQDCECVTYLSKAFLSVPIASGIRIDGARDSVSMVSGMTGSAQRAPGDKVRAQCFRSSRCRVHQMSVEPLNPDEASTGRMVTYVHEKRAKLPGAVRRSFESMSPLSPKLSFAPGVEVPLQIEKNGFGCVLETKGAPRAPLAQFLNDMKRLTVTPLHAFTASWTPLPQTMVPTGRTKLVSSSPLGMVHVPATPQWNFVVKGIEVEGGDQWGTDVQFPWEEEPMGRSFRGHRHVFEKIGPFFMDKHPVTNANYSAYLSATRYTPVDDSNWLRQWNGSSTPSTDIANRPVVYVSLAEARAYCAWLGARLPHSWEWQYSAQGLDGRKYPWGNRKNETGALPVLHSGRANPGPPPIGKHSPMGDSPFGVADLVGTVWQYTDEFQDDHTRSVLLRGGSNYRPAGSKWYFPNQPELDVHNKYFLFDDSYERAGTIGFRCLVDAEH